MADRRFDLVRTTACVPGEELLPEIARVMARGEDPADRFPEAARHVEGCARCATIVAELARRPEVDDVREVPVEPDDLFPRALAGLGLSDPDPVARARAASRLAEMARVPPAALAALAEAAAEDPEEDVRAAALAALDALDESVSLPQRVVDAWAESPAGAAPFIAGVLRRLGGAAPPGRGDIEELVAGEPDEGGTPLTGATSRGRLRERAGQVWLDVEGLPRSFEKTRPVVALPEALEETASQLRWLGDVPGLVRSKDRVRDGSVSVPLGAPGTRPAELRTFKRIYLLDPTRKRAPR